MFSSPTGVAPGARVQGPSLVEITQGQVYAKCGADAHVSQVCDRGATATDLEDGELTELVLACSPDGVRFKFSKQGVQCCGFNTTKPGVYNITFMVTDSSGANSTVDRQLKVRSKAHFVYQRTMWLQSSKSVRPVIDIALFVSDNICYDLIVASTLICGSVI